LAQVDEVGEGVLIDPLSPQDELVAEVTEVGDRAAETGQPQFEKDQEHFSRRGDTGVPVDRVIPHNFSFAPISSDVVLAALRISIKGRFSRRFQLKRTV
jgi:hypothetical protein